MSEGDDGLDYFQQPEHLTEAGREKEAEWPETLESEMDVIRQREILGNMREATRLCYSPFGVPAPH